MNTATSKTIQIGPSRIGLIGLDRALNIAAEKNLSLVEATEFIFKTIAKENYIPSGLTSQYRQALQAEYQKHMNLTDDDTDHLVIRIFGSTCISCNKLQVMLIEVLNNMNIAADIEQIHEPDEIGRYGVLHTPALIINGSLKCAGHMPTLAQVEQWVRDVTD